MEIFIVDSFTDSPFRGNPAGVCLLDGEKDSSWLQKVAREMNQSETAFLLKSEDGYSLRWFTPTVEVDLCGHATLASAHTLWEKGLVPGEDTIRFHTRSGLLTAKRNGELIELNFPTEPAEECEIPEGLLEALGVKAIYVGRNRMDYIIQVETEDEVKNLSPDFNLLAKAVSRGAIVTSKSNEKGIDVVSRFFCPTIGINEDPVTGSAHCCLGPFWSKRLNKDEFQAVQVSERRGSLKVKLEGDRVILGGRAVTVLRGELTNS